MTRSPLAIRASQMGLGVRSDWRLVSDFEWSLLGTSRGCDLMPPVFRKQTWMEPYVRKASDQEVRAFLQIMQTGTDAQHAAAVDAAVTKYADAGS